MAAQQPAPAPAPAPGQAKTTVRKRQAINKASKTMLIWVGAASVAVSFLLVASQYIYGQFVYNNKVISAKDKAINQLNENLKNIETLKSAFGPLDAGTNPYVNSTKILAALPRELDTSAFGSSLQKVIGPRSGITLESVKIEESDASLIANDIGSQAALDVNAVVEPQEIKATLTVAGSYEQLSKFIKDVEATIRPIRLATMNVSGSDTNTRAIIEMTTFYQPTKGVKIVTEDLRR